MKTFAKSLLAVALAVGTVVSAHATWTSEISGTTAYISDGNWKILLKCAGSRTGPDGAYFVWNVGDGSKCAITEGAGVLDLTGVTTDTGLILVQLGVNSCREYAGLTSIILPDTLEKIGNTTFYSCPNLESITPWLPGSVTSVGNQAFGKCTKFVPCEHLIITNDAFTAINGSAFGELAIKSVSFTSNLVSIGASAFNNCPITRISPMEFPKLKKVEGWNFNSGAIEGDVLKFTSPNLEQLGGPSAWSFTSVNVTNIVVSPTITTWQAFYKGPNLESITCMPMKRKLVPTETAITFKGFPGGCPKLTRVDLPFRKRFAIPDSAFAGATQLQDVYFWGAAPTSLGRWYNPCGNYVLRFHCAKQQDEEGWLAIADELTDEDRARETYPGPHCFGKTKYESLKNISWLVWDKSPYDPLGLMLLLR